MAEKEFMKIIIDAGVGGLIAALIIFLVYRMTNGLVFNVGMKMVAAFESQADAIARQAGSMDGLTKSIQDFVRRDGSEHREMLVLLKFIAQDASGRGAGDGARTQAGAPAKKKRTPVKRNTKVGG